MAKLLWNSKHEGQHRRHQWMALSQNPYVYMETMEETKDKSAKPNQDGCAGGLGMADWKQPQGTLVYNTYSYRKYANDKRKTDKQWLL
nr:hypothetical protein [uncultured Phocaeicola sp.]